MYGRKSDNQGVKEETFNQTGRRGGEGQAGWKGHGARQLEEQGGQGGWRLVDRAVLHWSVDKPRGTTGERDRPCNPGF